MRQTIPFHSKYKDAASEDEDWWRLIVEDNGSMHVEYQWSILMAVERESYP
jgi:hypothetical protein